MANKYLVLLKFLVNSNSHLVFEFEGKIKFIAVTYFSIYPAADKLDRLSLATEADSRSVTLPYPQILVHTGKDYPSRTL